MLCIAEDNIFVVKLNMEMTLESFESPLEPTDSYMAEIQQLQMFTGGIANKILTDVEKRTGGTSFTDEDFKALLNGYTEAVHAERKSSELSQAPFTQSDFFVSKEGLSWVPLAFGTEDSVDIASESLLRLHKAKLLYIGIEEKEFRNRFPLLSGRHKPSVQNPYNKEENLFVASVDIVKAADNWGILDMK